MSVRKSLFSRPVLGLAGLLAALLVVLASASAASATSYQHPFGAVFGSAEQPTFTWPKDVVVDRSTGDVLVADWDDSLPLGERLEIKRFQADGSPDPFTALGTNVIDGKAGPDETPEKSLEASEGLEIAIDETHGPAGGDIYVVQNEGFSRGFVDIFSSEGRYLGQIAGSTAGSFRTANGVAVDQAGALYISAGIESPSGRINGIARYAPVSNPPTAGEGTSFFQIEGYEAIYRLVMGVQGSAGSLFAWASRGHLLKISTSTGAFTDFFAGGSVAGRGGSVTVDPLTGNPLLQAPIRSQFSEVEAVELDGAGEQAGPPLSLLRVEGTGIEGLAVDDAGDTYVIEGPQDPRVFVYGQPAIVPTVNPEQPTDVTGTKATLRGSVEPSGLEVSECFFEWGETTHYGNKAACGGTIEAATEVNPVHLEIDGLVPNGATYHFRLAAKNENGTEYSGDESFATASVAASEKATVTGVETAILHGLVRSEGHQFTECFFEWGLAEKAGYENDATCEPEASLIPPDFDSHQVKAELGGLEEATRYRFRLVTTNSEGTRRGEEGYFETFGPPQISEVRARDATQSSVTIEAQVDPSGFDTSYRFEWGPTISYGQSVPLSPGSIGTNPTKVSASLSGLAAAHTYHYRVIATSDAGGTERVTATPDQMLETLDACGLPEQRCFELASRRDPGPTAQPGRFVAGLEIHFQAAEEPGSLAYLAEGGYPEATKGGEVLYRGVRGASDWQSTQLSPPVTTRDEQQGGQSQPSQYLGLSSDLDCGVVASNQPLTDDPVARLIDEAGGANLYRRNPDGTYTLITDVPPEELKAPSSFLYAEFELIGFTRDCAKVVFATEYHYSGVAGVGKRRLYEWTALEGLKAAAWIPGSGGEVVAEVSTPKAAVYHPVSVDGSRIFFTATRLIAGNPADPGEVGAKGLFVRENGSVTHDVSASQTSVADKGANFQGATPDGSRVFFTANAGLTSESSAEGTDLYEYDLEQEHLIDLSISHEAGGAEVAGLIGVSSDGSHVYFAARQQLVPGQGPAFSRNQSAGTYSVYDEHGNQLRFVGSVTEQDFTQALAATNQPKNSARVSPDGRYLLFQSSADVTGYESHGLAEVYLYDGEAASESTVCLSCRQDGQAPVNPHTQGGPLAVGTQVNPLSEPRSLVLRGGEPQAYFVSRDRLATGAPENEWSLYEWSHGQVFRIASEAPGTTGVPNGAPLIELVGASGDGTDLYFADAAPLNWENPEGRPAVWDARMNGGFPPPMAAIAPCDPNAEGACQGQAAGPPVVPSAVTPSFNGPGNVKANKPKKKRKHHKKHRHHHKNRHHKKRKKNGSKHGKGTQTRPAKHDRRAGK